MLHSISLKPVHCAIERKLPLFLGNMFSNLLTLKLEYLIASDGLRLYSYFSLKIIAKRNLCESCDSFGPCLCLCNRSLVLSAGGWIWHSSWFDWSSPPTPTSPPLNIHFYCKSHSLQLISSSFSEFLLEI